MDACSTSTKTCLLCLHNNQPATSAYDVQASRGGGGVLRLREERARMNAGKKSAVGSAVESVEWRHGVANGYRGGKKGCWRS